MDIHHFSRYDCTIFRNNKIYLLTWDTLFSNVSKEQNRTEVISMDMSIVKCKYVKHERKHAFFPV